MAGAGDDGYRDFLLPEFGSLPDVTDEQIVDICSRWFLAETMFVRHLLRRFAGNDQDLQREMAQETALSYYRAVAKGRGIARFIREHVTGRKPIRTPGALFNYTIQLHRRDAHRELIREKGRQRKHDPLPEDDTGEAADLDVNGPGGGETDERFDRCLRVRVELVDLAAAPIAPGTGPERVAACLDELESLCSRPLRRLDAVTKLTRRQRLVFLLRVEPLNEVDDTALEYKQIEPLAGILGIPMSVDNLKTTRLAAVLRLRKRHPELEDELRDG